MTEFSSFSKERDTIPQWVEWDNVLTNPGWKEFCQGAREHEAETILKDDTASGEAMQSMAVQVYELGEKLGDSYNAQPCRVVGFLYGDDDFLGNDMDKAAYFDTTKLQFGGSAFRCLDNRWRVVLEFYKQIPNREKIRKYYYTLPDDKHLIDFRIKPGHEGGEVRGLVNLLRDHVKGTKQFVHSRDFAALPAEQQRTWLTQASDDIDRDVPAQFRDVKVAVACTRYYTKYDDMPGVALQDTYTDLRDVDANERHSLEGEIIGFDYPEVRDVPFHQQLRREDLTANNGASCMVLRNGADGITYYVLPQSVSEVI